MLLIAALALLALLPAGSTATTAGPSAERGPLLETIVVPGGTTKSNPVTSKTSFDPKLEYHVVVSGVIEYKREFDGVVYHKADASWLFYCDGHPCEPPSSNGALFVGTPAGAPFRLEYMTGHKFAASNYEADHTYEEDLDFEAEHEGTWTFWDALDSDSLVPSGSITIEVYGPPSGEDPDSDDEGLALKFSGKEQGVPKRGPPAVIRTTFETKGRAALEPNINDPGESIGLPRGSAVLHEITAGELDPLIVMKLDGKRNLRYASDGRPATRGLKAGVVVTRSTDKRCEKDAKGALALADRPKPKPDEIVLQVCGRKYKWLDRTKDDVTVKVTTKKTDAA